MKPTDIEEGVTYTYGLVYESKVTKSTVKYYTNIDLNYGQYKIF